MNTFVENLTGMNTMTDQVIAMDCLMACKTAVKCYATAITETATPEVRSVLQKHLVSEIAAHEKMTNYVMSKGWYNPYNIGAQIQLDLKNAQTALNINM
jgi:similar to spore coat protein